jgi:hypothetical protein
VSRDGLGLGAAGDVAPWAGAGGAVCAADSGISKHQTDKAHRSFIFIKP